MSTLRVIRQNIFPETITSSLNTISLDRLYVLGYLKHQDIPKMFIIAVLHDIVKASIVYEAMKRGLYFSIPLRKDDVIMDILGFYKTGWKQLFKLHVELEAPTRGENASELTADSLLTPVSLSTS